METKTYYIQLEININNPIIKKGMKNGELSLLVINLKWVPKKTIIKCLR